jgi:alpha-beta hydrolase superfamily lysophospholipase
MPRLFPRLWAIRTAFRTVGVVAPALAARWAETLFPTVVLVHGWGSRASRLSALAAALVEAGFRAVAYDAPGTTSTFPPSCGSCRPRRW